MRMLCMNFLLLWVMLLCGCARRPAHSGIDYLIEPSDLTEPVRLVDCDTASPPHCKRIKASYKPGREKMVAPQVTK